MFHKNIPPHIPEFDAEMQLLEKDVSYLQEVLENLKKIQSRTEKLEKYYYEGQWIQDFEKYPNAPFGILSEDGLYNLLFEEQEARKEILKYLANRL